jgi:hypothetical protein
MTDLFGPGTTLESPATRAFAITPSDSVNLTVFSRAIYVGGAGNISVLTLQDNIVTFTGLLAGSILPIRVKRVNSTATTATGLVALA